MNFGLREVVARRASASPDAPALDVRGVGHSCLRFMQPVNLSAGKALCRFCGEQISTNRLSEHIAKAHPRPAKLDMTPTLVRTRAAGTEPRSK